MLGLCCNFAVKDKDYAETFGDVSKIVENDVDVDNANI
jgi:hypothetical protein